MRCLQIKNILLNQNLALLLFMLPAIISAQVTVGDCKVVYRVLAEGNDAANISKTSSKTFYVRGNKTLTETVFGNFKQSVFFNANDSTSVILKETGADKFITYLSKDSWLAQNARLMHADFKPLNEIKKILGYTCHKGIITKSAGDRITVYYTKDIKPTVSEYPYLFQQVPGLVLEYQTTRENNLKISYIASSVSLLPVAASVFDIPKQGYRILDQ